MPHTVVVAAARALLISTAGERAQFPAIEVERHIGSCPVAIRLNTDGSHRGSAHDRAENASTGTPNGWGQVMWPTTTTAWAWMPPPVRGGKIAHTTDGGKMWSRWLTPKTSWLQLATQGSQTAWFLGETNSGSNAIWLQTSNGGATWTRWIMRLPPRTKTALAIKKGLQSHEMPQKTAFGRPA